MHARAVLQNIEARGRTVGRRLAGFTLLAVTFSVLPGAAFAQTAPKPLLSLVLPDPVAGARCLAGEGCGKSAGSTEAIQPACVAEQTIKSIPPYLQAEALALSHSKLAEDCRGAAAVLARKREEIRELYERPPETSLPSALMEAAQNYNATCLSPQLELNHGPISPAERSFLREHTGLIVRRQSASGQRQQPICQAARLGRFIVTARNCIPPDVRSSIRPGDFLNEIAFRFFDHPTAYGLTLRQIGAGGDAGEEQKNDYAIFAIEQTPFLDEDVTSLLGTMKLFDNFLTATTNVTAMLSRGIQSGAVRDFNSAAYVRMNTLCRPAYIAPDGLFLHGCQIESVLSHGAPFFQRQNGKNVFVGIHGGDTSSLKQPALAACAPGLSKYGIAIPPSVLSNALSK